MRRTSFQVCLDTVTLQDRVDSSGCGSSSDSSSSNSSSSSTVNRFCVARSQQNALRTWLGAISKDNVYLIQFSRWCVTLKEVSGVVSVLLISFASNTYILCML
jgi:hypothetical protein